MWQTTQMLVQVFYVEVMTNPLVECGDLEGVVAFCKKQGLLAIIDATFATPVLCRSALTSRDESYHSCHRRVKESSRFFFGGGLLAGQSKTWASTLCCIRPRST